MKQKMKKRFFAMLLAVVMTLSLAACGSSEESAKSDADSSSGDKASVKVGLITYSLGEEFGVDTLSGMQKVADAEGWDLEAPDPAGDLQKQIAQLEDMIQKKMDVIIIAPVDGSAIVPYLQEAKDAGITVINYDIVAETDICDAVIAADNIGGGASAADELGEALGGEGKVLILTDNPGVVVIDERCKGFREEMEEKYPNIELVEQISNGTRDTHQKTTENMLTAHSDLAGIFAPDGDHTLGAYSACKQMDRTEVKVMGYDASPEQVTIMEEDGEDGIIIGSVAQFPILLGRVCGETAIRLLDGEKIEDTVFVDIGLAMANDIENFEFRE